MGHAFAAFLTGVGVYGGIAAAMLAVWGSVMTAIITIAAIFRECGGSGRRHRRNPATEGRG